MTTAIEPIQEIGSRIYTLRGVRVMLDRELSELYGVTTGNLNLAVKRNLDRFPSDFMFQLTKEEWSSLRLQFAILKTGRGKHPKYLPYAFTEQGIAMLSGVLKSKIATEVNIRIMRTFVELRNQITANPEYKLLWETEKRIESRMDMIETSNLVENTVVSTKVTQLSQDVKRVSDAFDKFQDGQIVIKRPDDGIGSG